MKYEVCLIPEYTSISAPLEQTRFWTQGEGGWEPTQSLFASILNWLSSHSRRKTEERLLLSGTNTYLGYVYKLCTHALALTFYYYLQTSFFFKDYHLNYLNKKIG